MIFQKVWISAKQVNFTTFFLDEKSTKNYYYIKNKTFFSEKYCTEYVKIILKYQISRVWLTDDNKKIIAWLIYFVTNCKI